MEKQRRSFILILCFFLALFAVTGCGKDQKTSSENEDGDQEEYDYDESINDGDSELALDGDVDIELSDSICENLLDNLPRVGERCPYKNPRDNGVAVCPSGQTNACNGWYIACIDGFWKECEIMDGNCSVVVNQYEFCCGCGDYKPTCEAA